MRIVNRLNTPVVIEELLEPGTLLVDKRHEECWVLVEVNTTTMTWEKIEPKEENKPQREYKPFPFGGIAPCIPMPSTGTEEDNLEPINEWPCGCSCDCKEGKDIDGHSCIHNCNADTDEVD